MKRLGSHIKKANAKYSSPLSFNKSDSFKKVINYIRKNGKSVEFLHYFNQYNSCFFNIFKKTRKANKPDTQVINRTNILDNKSMLSAFCYILKK